VAHHHVRIDTHDRTTGYKPAAVWQIKKFFGALPLDGVMRSPLGEGLLHCSRPHDAPRGSAMARPHYLANYGSRPEPATISPCTITMDHDAIICSMIDRLA
jgi:hypothetical protein